MVIKISKIKVDFNRKVTSKIKVDFNKKETFKIKENSKIKVDFKVRKISKNDNKFNMKFNIFIWTIPLIFLISFLILQLISTLSVLLYSRFIPHYKTIDL